MCLNGIKLSFQRSFELLLQEAFSSRFPKTLKTLMCFCVQLLIQQLCAHEVACAVIVALLLLWFLKMFHIVGSKTMLFSVGLRCELDEADVMSNLKPPSSAAHLLRVIFNAVYGARRRGPELQLL